MISESGVVVKDGVVITQVMNGGYWCVNLKNKEKRRLEKVHREVAKLFVDKPIDIRSYFVEHKDGDKGNNHYLNLEWKECMVFGVGYNCPQKGEVYYETKVMTVWKEMLGRCYNINFKDRMNYGGRGVKVEIEWFDFNNFSKWYVNNTYDVMGNERLQLDKDILYPDNLTYGEEYCVLVPNGLNMLFRQNSKRDMSVAIKLQKYLNDYHENFSPKLNIALVREIEKCRR